MLQIQVMLEVPLKIAAGLASGQLELLGGVVREKATGQIVALLREGGRVASNTDLANGILRTVLQANSGGLLSTLTGVANLAATARSHYLIMQKLQALTSLVGLVGGIGLLNLAATAVSTGIILKRLNELEQAIKDLGVDIAKQFEANRKVKMEAAINAANLALSMECEDDRRAHSHFAINELFEARQHVWREIDTLKGSSHYAKNNELMQKNIEQAMHLDTLYSRCLLELGNVSLAKAFVNGKLSEYQSTSRILVHRHLGTHRAAYFHISILDEDLRRYIAIEHWLHDDENRLLEILLGNRRDFFNTDVADKKEIKKPGKERYIDALTQSELLIENIRRFEGFHVEIEAVARLGISYSEWEKQQEEALAKAEKNLADFTNLEEYDDYVLFVDKEWLAEQSDSTGAEQ
ncbi:MAG: hypothetical protein OXG84_01615 [Chloroflexi bacterium]|nr:hypothetical protein [Chloroflexota bacterium]